MAWLHHLYSSMAFAHTNLHSKSNDTHSTVMHLPAVQAVSQPSNRRQEVSRTLFDVMRLPKATLQCSDTSLSRRTYPLEAI